MEQQKKEDKSLGVASVHAFVEEQTVYIMQLEEENARLAQQSQEHKSDAERMHGQIARQNEEKINFDAILQEREEAQRRLAQEVAEKDGRLTEMAESIAGHMHRASEAEKEAGRVKGEYVSLQEVMAREREAREQARKDAGALKGAADDLERRLAESRQAVAGKDSEVQRLGAEVEGYRAEAARHKETAREFQARAETAEQRLGAAQSRLSTLDRLQRDAEQYQAKITLLDKRLVEQARTLEEAKEQAAKYKADYEKSHQLFKGVEAMARDLGGKVRAQETDIVRYGVKIKEYEDTIKTNEQVMSDLREELRRAGDNLRITVMDKNALENSLREAKGEITHYKTLVNSLGGLEETLDSLRKKRERLARRASSGSSEAQA